MFLHILPVLLSCRGVTFDFQPQFSLTKKSCRQSQRKFRMNELWPSISLESTPMDHSFVGHAGKDLSPHNYGIGELCEPH